MTLMKDSTAFTLQGVALGTRRSGAVLLWVGVALLFGELALWLFNVEVPSRFKPWLAVMPGFGLCVGGGFYVIGKVLPRWIEIERSGL
jgi:hypothetical protein